MTLPLYQVDAFTDEPFAGNPAAVVVLDEPRHKGWMQRVAAEMNLSETAFVELRSDGAYELRWFTPAVEVELCGHATLAAAHVLWETERVAEDKAITFRTLYRGDLRCARRGGWIGMDFPADRPHVVRTPPGLADALGKQPEHVLRSRYDYLCIYPSAERIRQLRPDWRKLATFDVRGTICTAPSNDNRHDFVSRFFAPSHRVDEDPVTGSAHCVLGPYWAERLEKSSLIGYQASRRGGSVRVALSGDDRVTLGGRAVTVFEGALKV